MLVLSSQSKFLDVDLSVIVIDTLIANVIDVFVYHLLVYFVLTFIPQNPKRCV